MVWYGLLKQTKIFLKAVFHEIYLVHSWILCLKWEWKPSTISSFRKDYKNVSVTNSLCYTFQICMVHITGLQVLAFIIMKLLFPCGIYNLAKISCSFLTFILTKRLQVRIFFFTRGMHSLVPSRASLNWLKWHNLMYAWIKRLLTRPCKPIFQFTFG